MLVMLEQCVGYSYVTLSEGSDEFTQGVALVDSDFTTILSLMTGPME